MNAADIHEFCKELNEFYRERFKYNPNYRRYRCHVWANKIDVKTPKYRLCLSWQDYDNKIAITSISFTQTHAGHGTAFLTLLVSLSKKYGYERIEFISVCTEPMKQFVKKYNFINHPQQKLFDEDDGWSKDWSCSVADLVKMGFSHYDAGY
ncbi:hypothetical protein [Cellvibrio sp. QJXJ]|uniref:hypothetical protein n=1 Tax=Cellvibrio sp. QJXJ TaxID=2964606 RepID=UPI0021C4C02B|nr:hypothetical protein [Cellvibrio sp. QJXJ]UUA74268.1 hypothetical protein NNX04_07455 [Cellvibrio sp. QJXJ]